MIRLLLILAAFGAGYLYGKNQATIKTVLANQDRIEGASDVATGLGKIFG